MVRMKNKYIIKIIVFSCSLFISFTLGFLTVIFLSSLNISSFKNPSLTLPKILMVESGSMEPVIKTGGIIVTLPSKSYQMNDIVTFFYDNDEKNLITHRIEVRKFDRSGQAIYLTSGEANKTFDEREIMDKNIVGKVVLTLPYLGYFADFAKKPLGFILLIIIPATIIIYEEFKNLWREILVWINKLKKTKLFNGFTKKHPGEATPATTLQGNIHRLAIAIPFFGAFLLFVAISSSYFSDSEVSGGNSFTAYIPTVTPTPAVANHIVISEVQISGDGINLNDDEFVELYNPTSSPIIMSRWRLTRENSAGTEANLVLSLNGTIPAHGYFLIVDADGYNGGVTRDVEYSAPSNELTNNYTVLLYSDAGISLIDKVGFGTPSNPEAAPFSSNPSLSQSIERKAYSLSTKASMEGGVDSVKGNGFDSDNNSLDFILRNFSDPQNSSSPIETP